MKRFMCGLGGLLLFCSAATAQISLLNEATNGLFKNVNDFVIKPNIMFNTVETKQIIIGGGFDNLGFESNTTGGGLVGYFHPGSIPWSVAGSLDMISTLHKVEDKNNARTIEYKNPAFDEYSAGLRFTLGIPSALNLSVGVVAEFSGSQENGTEVTTTNASGTVTTIVPNTEKFSMLLGVPVGLEFTPSLYNFFEFYVMMDKTTSITGTTPETKKEDAKTTVTFLAYDKLTIEGLLPNPFGSETTFWLGMGNADLIRIPDVETPSYVRGGSIPYEVKFSTQLGMANLVDLSVGGVELRMRPMVYIDFLLGTHKSWTFGTTLAAATGAYVPLGNLPLTLFFGVTPAFQFYNTTSVSQPSENIRTTSESRSLSTNILWSGKVGTSIALPKNMVLDVALNMNTNTKSLGLSAQMTIAL